MVGIVAAIHYWKPSLILLSEFGEELNAVRHLIAEKIEKLLKEQVFAVDLNFRVDLDTLDLFCFKSRAYSPRQKIRTHYDGSNQLFFINEDNLSPTERKELEGLLGKGINVF